MSTNNTIQTFWIGIGNLSSFAVSILSAAVLSRYLNISDYGTFKQILYVYTVLQIIFSAGLPSVFSYFLPQHTIEYGYHIVLKITNILFISGLFFSLFLFLFSNNIAEILNNDALSESLKLFSPIPFFNLPTMGVQSIFATYKKTYVSAIYDVITRTLMFIGMTFPIIYFNKDYKFGIICWGIASAISMLIAMFFKKIPFRNQINLKSDLSYLDILRYSLPIVVASIWGIAARASDQFYISRYYGNEVFAIFSNGFIELPFVTMITSASAAVLLPQFTKLIREPKGVNQLLVLWRSALSKSALIIYPILIFFYFNSNEIIDVLYSSRYHQSSIYFQIALSINFFNIVIFAPLMFAINKTRFYSYLHLFAAILTWLLGYISVSFFNTPIIIAIFSVVISILKVIVAFRFIANYFKISVYQLFPIKILLKYILHSLLVLLILKILYIYVIDFNLNSFSKIILNLFLYIIGLLVTAKFYKIDYYNLLIPTLSKMFKHAK